MKERIGKIKTHVRENRFVYIYCGVTAIVVAGFTTIIMKGRHAGIPRVPDGSEMVTVRPFSFLSNRQSVVTVVEREGRGHPGYIIRCLETGEIFISQVEAAIAANTYPSVMSGHLSGKLPDVHGKHFERLGVMS